MRLKKQPVMVLSLDEQKRLTSFYELLIAIDRQVGTSRSKEKKTQARSRKSVKSFDKQSIESSPTGRTFLLLAIVCFIQLIYYFTNSRNAIWRASMLYELFEQSRNTEWDNN
jgi:hypothetical protein